MNYERQSIGKTTELARVYALFGALLQAQNYGGVPKFENMRGEKNVPSLGTGDANKMGEFSEKVSKGGGAGSFSIQKYVAEFEPLNRAISDVFRKKLHHDFLKMRGGEGGQKTLGTFPKIHPFW